MKSEVQRDLYTPMFLITYLTISKTRNQAKYCNLMNGQGKNVLLMCNGILFNHKKMKSYLQISICLFRLNLQCCVLLPKSTYLKQFLPLTLPAVYVLLCSILGKEHVTSL